MFLLDIGDCSILSSLFSFFLCLSQVPNFFFHFLRLIGIVLSQMTIDDRNPTMFINTFFLTLGINTGLDAVSKVFFGINMELGLQTLWLVREM
jgi:hypothetical protein